MASDTDITEDVDRMAAPLGMIRQGTSLSRTSEATPPKTSGLRSHPAPPPQKRGHTAENQRSALAIHAPVT